MRDFEEVVEEGIVILLLIVALALTTWELWVTARWLGQSPVTTISLTYALGGILFALFLWWRGR